MYLATFFTRRRRKYINYYEEYMICFWDMVSVHCLIDTPLTIMYNQLFYQTMSGHYLDDLYTI